MTERRRAERRRAEIDWKFYKKVFWLALPIALQSLITIGVNMLDTIMVGNLGEMSLSAVSLANQFIGVYQIFCMGLGMGASVLVSRYWGMQEAEPVKSIQALRKTICIVVRITVSLALLFAVVTLLIPQVVMRMYTQDAEIIRLGEIYFRFSVITYFFLGLSLVCTIILRCVGQVKLPLLVSIGAFFVNLLANYVFIFGKLGMPRMGIAGAALGTLIARLFEAGMICGYLLLKDEKIGFRVKHLGMKTADLLGEYIRISIPVLISDGILAIGNNTVALVIGRLGVTYVAAYGALTEISYQTPQNYKNVLGHAAYLLNGIAHLPTIKARKMRIEYDGKTLENNYLYGMVTNATSVAKLLSLSDVEWDDGLFEVTLIRKPTDLVQFHQLILSLANFQLGAERQYLDYFRASHVTITNLDEEEVAWTIDGEYGGNQRVNEISNCQKALNIFVPNTGKTII